MHLQPRPQPIKLNLIADQINEQFRAASTHANEARSSGNAAVLAAFQCGLLLTRAKRIAGLGNWQKWLMDNCPKLSESTAKNWMRLARTLKVGELKECRQLTDAYVRCGILPERPAAKDHGIGTATVLLEDVFTERATNRLASLYQFLSETEITAMPETQRETVKENLKPFVELWERL